jgi:hypothetical protein
MTSSVSGNDIYRACLRIQALNCYGWSSGVHRRMSQFRAVVTQLATRQRCQTVRMQTIDAILMAVEQCSLVRMGIAA